MDPQLVVTLGVAGGILGATLYARVHTRRAFLRDCAAYNDVEPIETAWMTIGLKTRGHEPAVVMHAAGGGKNNPSRWDIASSVPALGARTKLSVDREGVLGGLREKLGREDVHTGDKDFDARYCIRGSDEDVVRAVMQRPAVQAAVQALFADMQVQSCVLDEVGDLRVRAWRGPTTAASARDKALRVAALARALAENADAPPMPAGRSLLRSTGVGGGSGAPVGISVGERT